MYLKSNYIKIILFFLSLSSLLLAKPLKDITLQLQWKHQFEFAGFYAAEAQGYYRDIGLNVKFKEYQGQNITDIVLEGKATFGIGSPGIIADYIEGKPILFVANFFKQSPLVLLTQKNIDTLSKLANKQVMGLTDTVKNITILTMLEKFHITAKNLHFITKSNSDIANFILGKIDATIYKIFT